MIASLLVSVARSGGNAEEDRLAQRCCRHGRCEQRRYVLRGLSNAAVTKSCLIDVLRANDNNPLFSVFAGIPVKSTLDNSTTVQYAGLISQLADKARSVVRDLDPTNDLTFLRVRSKKHEIMVAPDKDFILIVIQNPTD